MSRVCYFTGKRTVAGRSTARRGKAKHLGGVGKFRPLTRVEVAYLKKAAIS